MKKPAACLLACFLATVSVLASCMATDRPTLPAKRSADLVLRNGAVYTVDAVRSWADAVAVAGGRIVYVGPESGIKAWIGPRTRVIDLQGKMLLPGFHDVHTHLVEGGVQLSECRLGDRTTVEQVLQAVKRYADEHPKAAWIRGGGWQLPLFPDANPHKKLLDETVPGRPVVLMAADGHSAWVSSRALELAGITKETPDPPNGRIERDPKTGEPTARCAKRRSACCRKRSRRTRRRRLKRGSGWLCARRPAPGSPRSRTPRPVSRICAPMRRSTSQIAVTRRDPGAGEGEAWLPQHLVDLPAMLACYTINGAYTNFEERETGSIDTGKAADLVVLDRNLFTVPKSQIARTKVLLTLLEGRETWRDPAFSQP